MTDSIPVLSTTANITSSNATANTTASGVLPDFLITLIFPVFFLIISYFLINIDSTVMKLILSLGSMLINSTTLVVYYYSSYFQGNSSDQTVGVSAVLLFFIIYLLINTYIIIALYYMIKKHAEKKQRNTVGDRLAFNSPSYDGDDSFDIKDDNKFNAKVDEEGVYTRTVLEVPNQRSTEPQRNYQVKDDPFSISENGKMIFGVNLAIVVLFSLIMTIPTIYSFVDSKAIISSIKYLFFCEEWMIVVLYASFAIQNVMFFFIKRPILPL